MLGESKSWMGKALVEQRISSLPIWALKLGLEILIIQERMSLSIGELYPSFTEH